MSETRTEYTKWLKWFIANGGKPTHYYDYPFDRQDFILAKQDGRYLGGCGSQSINLIVPEHVTSFTVDAIGHSTIYQYDIDKMKNAHFVPQFEDVCLDYSARAKEREESIKWEKRMEEMEKQYLSRQNLLSSKYDNHKCEQYVTRAKQKEERRLDLEEKKADYKAQMEGKARMDDYNNKKANEGWLQLIGIGAFFLILYSFVMAMN